MKILIDNKLYKVTNFLKDNYDVFYVNEKNFLKEFNKYIYDIAIGININLLKRNINEKYTYVISIGDNKSKDVDLLLSNPVTTSKINDAVIRGKKYLETIDPKSIIHMIETILKFKNEDAGKQIKKLSYLVRYLCETIYVEKVIPLTKHQINEIVEFSVIHDLGKIGIPDEILNSTKIYTAKEREIMKKHPLIGAKFFSDFMTNKHIYSSNIAYNIIRYHHEKFDGSGYPDGLKGDNIPLEARIVAVADVYDALVSERSYKKAFSHSDACEILRRDSGTHFDPYIISCFFKNESKVIDLYQNNKVYDSILKDEKVIYSKDKKIVENKKSPFITIVIIILCILGLSLAIWGIISFFK